MAKCCVPEEHLRAPAGDNLGNIVIMTGCLALPAKITREKVKPDLGEPLCPSNGNTLPEVPSVEAKRRGGQGMVPGPSFAGAAPG